jgi:pimeloyl-ACP methyl ester carboxylesterase
MAEFWRDRAAHDVLQRCGGRPRSIALDQRGWGGSVATDGRYDLSAMADDAETVARTLGLTRYVLVGHSMGDKVAQIVATRRPDGLGARKKGSLNKMTAGAPSLKSLQAPM